MISAFFQLPQSKKTGRAETIACGPRPTPGVGAGSIANPGNALASIEQMLHEHAAGRVADQDRLFRAVADDPVIMVEDLGDAEGGKLLVR